LNRAELVSARHTGQNTVDLERVFDDGANIFGSIKNMHNRLVLVGVVVGRVDSKTVGDSLALFQLIISNKVESCALAIFHHHK
jgi:hypothetical protein